MNGRIWPGIPPAGIAKVIDRWFDAAGSGAALGIFLALFVAIWSGFQIFSYAAIDLHPDLVEVFAWSQQLAPGYKHPPLAAFVAAAWFSIFPTADWAFHLLAMVNAAFALFVIGLIARRYLDGDKRLLALLLLLLTPFYQFHAQRFSTNQVLLAVWPLATYCFLRSFETRTLIWGAAAGATAALAILGKYYSAMLVAGLVVAALVHPRRLDYLRSPAPWAAVVAGFIVLSPHLHWLLTTGALPIDYVYRAHSGMPMARLLRKLVTATLGAAGFVVVLLAGFALVARPDRRAWRLALWPPDPDRRMLVVLLSVPLLLPILISPISGIEISGLWTMPAWFLLPIVLLAPTQVVVRRPDAVLAAFVVLCISLIVLAAAPAIAWARFVQERNLPGRAHFAAVSEELTRQWRQTMQRPLAIVAGDLELGSAVTFYSSEHPQLWNNLDPHWTPWITRERLIRSGWAAVCPAADRNCLGLVERDAAKASGVIRLEFVHAATFLGRRGSPVPFVFVLVPPAR